eukprot:3147053-Amphidinium_carterae.1
MDVEEAEAAMERRLGKPQSSKSVEPATLFPEETVMQPTAVDVPSRGGKAKGGKGKRSNCRGCQKFLDPNAMANMTYCVAYKKITDRIYACA